MGAFFAAKGLLGLKNCIWIALIAAIVALSFVAVSIFDHADQRKIAIARDAGATSAVNAGQNQTLTQLGDANHAEQDLRARGERSAERYSQCLLDSERPAGCERYKPISQ